MQLNDFQRRFKDLMLDHPKALDNPPEDLAAFCAEGDIPLPDRLKVYRNNIVGSLTDVMLTTLPIMENLVGKEFMEVMARSFILENPPTQGCLSLYGEGFAEFVEGFELAKSLPYLPDVARFELALNKSYYAQDDEALSAEALSAIAPEDLGDLELCVRNSVQLIQSPYPLTAIRDFCMDDERGDKLDLNQGGDYIMVYRPQLDTQVIKLAEDEFEMLNNLMSGKTLGEAVENTLNTYPSFDFELFLQKHIILETFMGL